MVLMRVWKPFSIEVSQSGAHQQKELLLREIPLKRMGGMEISDENIRLAVQ